MGIAIIFGLMVSTFLTLVITPTLYSFSDDLSKKIFGRKKKAVAEAVVVAETVKES
jgi:hypothetical protein